MTPGTNETTGETDDVYIPRPAIVFPASLANEQLLTALLQAQLQPGLGGIVASPQTILAPVAAPLHPSAQTILAPSQAVSTSPIRYQDPAILEQVMKYIL